MNQRTLLWGGVAAIIVVAIVVGVLLTQGEDATAGEIEVTPEAATVGSVLPPLPASGADPATGQPAPAISTRTVSDEPVEIQPADGTVRVIGFFAHWCPHCQAELPRVTSHLAAEGTPDGVDIVAVSTAVDESRPNYPPSAWFTTEGWTRPLLVDSPDSVIASAYGLSGFPFWVLVAGDGTVVERYAGELDNEGFEALIQEAAAAAR